MQFLPTGAVVLAVLFVNGWTDAPNSIAAVVASRALPFRRAAALAAVCELAGVLASSLLFPTVAETVFSLARLGTDPTAALLALRCALLGVIVWAAAAWRFGLPTSESHALLAGLTGAAAALGGGLSAVNGGAWAKVLAGLVLSTGLGGIAGRWAAERTARLSPSPRSVRRGQISLAALMAFLHGAQDGQKFLALLLLQRSLAAGRTEHVFAVSLPDAALCAGVMALGVLCGGRHIIDTVARGMGPLRPVQSLAADGAGAACLLTASLLGLPVSTTHTKVSAMLGAGSLSPAQGSRRAAVHILLAWLFTFPGAGGLAWLITRLTLG